MDAPRKPLIIALYSDAPRAGKSTSAKVLQRLAYQEGLAVDVLSFAFPIRRAARQVLPANWSDEKVREHLSGSLKDTPIGELGGRTGRDLLKIVGNTIRRRVRDDLWADRLMEEIDTLGGPVSETGSMLLEGIDQVGHPGIVIIDDMRWPGEYQKVVEREGFKVRLVTTRRADNAWGSLPLRPDDPREEIDGLLVHADFDAVVPAKGLVPQAVLEKLIEDLWYDKIKPVVAQRG